MPPEELRECIHKMGGDLEVISRVDEGSTFGIRLPVSDAV
jgi:signal transduction histidine kinase